MSMINLLNILCKCSLYLIQNSLSGIIPFQGEDEFGGLSDKLKVAVLSKML